MKFIFSYIFVFIIASQVLAGGVIFDAGGVSSGGSGFVGNKLVSETGSTYSASDRFHTPFTCSQTGPVNYMYFDPGSSSLLDLGYTNFVVWNSSGVVVAEASSCGATNVSGTLWRMTLDSELELAASVYWLGIATNDADWYIRTTSTAGNTYNGGATGGFNSCPGASASTTQASTHTSFEMSIWLSNSDSDTHD